MSITRLSGNSYEFLKLSTIQSTSILGLVERGVGVYYPIKIFKNETLAEVIDINNPEEKENINNILNHLRKNEIRLNQANKSFSINKKLKEANKITYDFFLQDGDKRYIITPNKLQTVNIPKIIDNVNVYYLYLPDNPTTNLGLMQTAFSSTNYYPFIKSKNAFNIMTYNKVNKFAFNIFKNFFEHTLTSYNPQDGTYTIEDRTINGLIQQKRITLIEQAIAIEHYAENCRSEERRVG